MFNPSGTLVAADGDSRVKIYDARTGARLRDIDYETEIRTVAFSPCGQWIAVGGADWEDVRALDKDQVMQRLATRPVTLGVNRGEAASLDVPPLPGNLEKIAKSALSAFASMSGCDAMCSRLLSGSPTNFASGASTKMPLYVMILTDLLLTSFRFVTFSVSLSNSAFVELSDWHA